MGSARAVRVAFKQLYEDGLAYRGQKLINWCPGCGTSVSDLEVIGTPEDGKIWSVRYHLLPEGSEPGAEPSVDESITVATTRPETNTRSSSTSLPASDRVTGSSDARPITWGPHTRM